jgi:prepilin-type N-terminal cleavage/methylation domain-containing protein
LTFSPLSVFIKEQKRMQKLLKLLHYGQRGFTLIELLIALAILGIISTVVLTNTTGFMNSGTLEAANTEVANVRTAAVSYHSDHESWPDTSEVLASYLVRETQATYDFDTSGKILSATTDADGWGTDIWFNPETQMWEEGTPPEE